MTSIDTKRLESTDYEHPLDREALKALRKIPGIDKVAAAYLEFLTKINIKVELLGNDLLITPKTSPRIHRLKQIAMKRLDIKQDYPVYQHLEWDYNAFAIGAKEPVIMLNSSVVQDLSDTELLYVIGHEMGHIKSGHVLYRAMTQWILDGMSVFLSNFVTAGLRLALYEWSRKSELTADRAGLLACDDLDACLLAEAKLMGMPTDTTWFTPSQESVVEQAQGFDFNDFELPGKIAYFFLTLDRTHPWGALRIRELQKWVQTAQYHDLKKLVSTFD